MITMTTFMKWMHEQESREDDPVGWFARFWRDLESKPRISAPASVTRHLEDRDLFRSVQGLTEAHDAAMAEFRKTRGTDTPLAPNGFFVPDPPPGAARIESPEDFAREASRQGPAGQAVARASAAGLAAAQDRRADERLARIEARLDAIMVTLGLAEPPELPWSEWFRQADLGTAGDADVVER